MTGFWHITWLISPELLIESLVLSAIAAATLSLLVIFGGPVDKPRERGVHLRPTPTSGGLAVMAGAALVIGAIVYLNSALIPGNLRDGLLLFGFASLMGLSGALDDLIDMPPQWRLGFQIGLCLIFAYYYRVTTLSFGGGLIVYVPPFFGLIGSAAWLLLGINAINFMDGSNGLAPGTQAIALLVISLLIIIMAPFSPLGSYLGVILLICVCALGAHLGFLPFNLPLGRAFQGDAGALFGGALITGACLVIKAYAVGSVWFGGFLLAPLLVDVVLTLVVRIRQRKNLFRPHKEHLYQLWLQRRDPSHGRLAIRIWMLCAISGLTGLGARLLNAFLHYDVRFYALVVILAIYSACWLSIRKRLMVEPGASLTASAKP